MLPAPPVIRPMTTADAGPVASLSGQLGYPVPSAVVAERLGLLARDPGHGCYVAESDGAVVGWVHVCGVRFLTSPAFFAEIGGLVVDANARRQGAGRALVFQAEAWAQANGYAEVRLRSGLHRTDAHKFYESVGHALTKTSHMFRKVVAASAPEAASE